MKIPRASRMWMLAAVLTVSSAGIAAVVEESDRIYSVLERAFYLSAQDAVWIRPGLKLAILNISIPADRRVVVTFKITDDAGGSLDRTGAATPGVVTTSFTLAAIPANGDQY